MFSWKIRAAYSISAMFSGGSKKCPLTREWSCYPHLEEHFQPDPDPYLGLGMAGPSLNFGQFAVEACLAAVASWAFAVAAYPVAAGVGWDLRCRYCHRRIGCSGPETGRNFGKT